MAGYEVLIKPSAVREIERLPKKKVRRKLTRRIEGLASELRPAGSERLSRHERFRARRGPYRIVFEVDHAKRTVLVVMVGHRRDVGR